MGEGYMQHDIPKPTRDKSLTLEEFRELSRKQLDYIYQGIKDIANDDPKVTIDYYKNEFSS